MTATKFTATFPSGHVAVRRSESPITHASMRFGARQARFHGSEAAARKAAGSGGQVVEVVASGSRSSSPAPSSGCRFVVGPGGVGRCGARVVAAAGSSRASCAAHAWAV